MENKKIGKVLLDLTDYDPGDVYSDGPVEDEMLELAKDGSAEKITAVLNSTNSWPIFYHFSPERENILSWYPFQKDACVLEIGAGCGAITGVLTQKCGKVTANDLSLKRCEINAWRHRESENLEIVVSNFRQMAARQAEAFDYVTLIGVFEYAASYIQTDDPYSDLLRMAGEMLKPGGKLLIAIENRFGAKYFAGCAEDHLGTCFSGISGYSRESKVKTMNYREWVSLLKQNGYANDDKHTDYRFYYPYPDYKFPYRIFSDERLPEKGELIRNINNLDQDRFILFDESRFWDSIAGTGYFRDFSNSYFIEITKKANAKE